MAKYKFDKLVRDNIVSSIIASGATPKYKILDKAELKIELIKKIIEEAKEITNARPEDVASEIADVEQAIDDLREICNISAVETDAAKKKKLNKVGGFRKAYYVYYVDASEDNVWTKYYRENADRYPEM